jgi:glucose/mannose-6-phosphate isomerase
VLRAVTGVACSTPIVTERGLTLPGWIGPLDLVIAVSCSGGTEETLALAEEAARRGCRLLTVGAVRTPLAALSAQARGTHVPVVPAGRPPRACIWALSIPLVVAADALGLTAVPESALVATANRLDALAGRCGPTVQTAANPAKALALAFSEGLPVVWGSGDVAEVATYRLACQLAENAKTPAVWGALPEVGHNGIVTVDGPYAVGAATADDFFRDRVADPDGATRLRIVILRDSVEHARVAARRRAVRAVGEARGLVVSEVVAEGDHPLERLASLVAVGDFASTYLAVGSGIDPTPIAPIDELKERIAP